MKGQKICAKCSAPTGPRTKVCHKCGTQFTFSPKPRMRVKVNELENWRSLSVGQVIKALQGYGPHYINAEDERVSMGYAGTFRVKFVDETGIGTYPVGKTDESGFCYLYMGPACDSAMGIIKKEPHKIVLVTNGDEVASQRV